MATPPWHSSRWRDNVWLSRIRQLPYGESEIMPDEPLDIFTERLKKARNLRGFNQTQLADEAGLPQSSVSHFEAGDRKPSFDNLRRLATALNVTTDYLLGRADSPDASGSASRIHRDMHKLSSDDLKLTEGFVDLLLQRGSKKAEQ
jgi:transcriptional regulator with XRE-family HTH domain